MEFHVCLKLFFVVMFVVSIECLPQRPWPPVTPVCTSHSKLCDVTFEINDAFSMTGPMTYESESTVCRCPGKDVCPTNEQNDAARTIYLESKSPGLSIKTKLRYCAAKNIPKRMCRPEELVMTLRGAGPMITDVVGEVNCRCSTPLALHATRTEGVYSLMDYTCGKKICGINKSEQPVCERVSSVASMFGYSLQSEFPCQCPVDFECSIDPTRVPENAGETADFYCELAWRK